MLTSEHIMFRNEDADRQLCLWTGGTAGDGDHQELYAFGQSLHDDMNRYSPTLLHCGSRGGLVLAGLLATWTPTCPLLVVNAFGQERALFFREGDGEQADYADAEHNPLAQRVPPRHALENEDLVLILVRCGDCDYMSKGRDVRSEFQQFSGTVLVYHNREDDHTPKSLKKVVVDLHQAALELQLQHANSSAAEASSVNADSLLKKYFGPYVHGSPFKAAAPCEFSLKLAGNPQWAVLSADTFSTFTGQSAGVQPGALMAAIQARQTTTQSSSSFAQVADICEAQEAAQPAANPI